MFLSRHLFFAAVFVFSLVNLFSQPIFAQKRLRPKVSAAPVSTKRPEKTAVIINEHFSVLRLEPSLYAMPIQRISRGQTAVISGEKQAEGVTFLKTQTSRRSGWIQAEAFLFPSRNGEDARLAELIKISDGFDRLELINLFLIHFPNSNLRPPILLQTGDLMEEVAQKLTTEANRRTTNDEIRVYGTSLRSIFLNYNGLDRYKKLGFGFVFNENTRRYHYDGWAWREITNRFSDSKEAPEAKRKFDALLEKMKNPFVTPPNQQSSKPE